MPIVLQARGYRFWFYSADLVEPPHVHVGKDGREAKYWLDPVRLAQTRRFRPYELNEIERILEQHQATILVVWFQEQSKHGSR